MQHTQQELANQQARLARAYQLKEQAEIEIAEAKAIVATLEWFEKQSPQGEGQSEAG